MSMYNMINGNNPAVTILLPMLGKHYNEYPRFRDCWVNAREWKLADNGMPYVGDKEDYNGEAKLYVYTRVGGGNRDDYEDEIEELRSMPTYIEDYDDAFDSTYATFVFGVPDEWKDDFYKLLEGEQPSEAYVRHVASVLPELYEKS